MTGNTGYTADISRETRCRILVVGVGGGACSVLSHALADWPNPPTVAAVNTDAEALAASKMEFKVPIGRTIAQGLGAGGDAELGRLAANEDMDALRTLVSDHDLLILVASLGGGTATGAAPILAKLARDEGLMVLAYVTTPFDFEGSRRQEQAQEGLAELKQNADAVICLPNQRLYAMLSPGTPLGEAFAFVDRMMTAGIRGLWTLLSQNNMLNLDFSDLQSLVSNSGNECVFGYGEGAGPEKAVQALDELLTGPMMEKGQILANSGAMILSITGGPDLSLAELEMIRQRFQEAARPGAHTAIGAAVLEDWNGRLALTVLAAEHWMPSTAPAPAPKTISNHFFADPAGAVPAAHAAKKEVKQGIMELGDNRGRFQDMAPTTVNGEDLDIPTYIRRGIRLPT
jgi:cell division protein FtsZ